FEQFKSLQISVLKPSGVAHFFEVVIFCGHPEYRHRRNSAARQLLGNLYCRQGLIDRIRWPAEEAYLLPRNHSNGAISEMIQVSKRLRPSSERDVLFPQEPGDFRPSFGRIVGLPRHTRQSLHCRRVPVKCLHALKTIQECDKELWLMRQLVERESAAIHEPLDDTHGKT